MSERKPLFIQEDIVNAHKYVERVKGRVDAGQLTDEHLQSAQAYLAGVEFYEPHRPHQLSRQTIRSKEEGEKFLPKILVNPETKRVEIPKYEIATKIPGKVEWVLFTYLAQNPNKDLPKQILIAVAQQAGSSANDIRDLIYRLRKSLEPDSKNPLIITTTKIDSKYFYSLNAKVEFVEDEKEKEKKKVTKPKETQEERRSYTINLSERSLTDQVTGTVLDIIDDLDFVILAKIAQSQQKGFLGETIARICREAGDKKGPSHGVIKRLRSIFNDTEDTPKIITQTGKTRGTRYFLNADVELISDEKTIQEVSSTQPETDEKQPVASPDQQAAGSPRIDSAQRTYVPYKATEDEKRSSAENRTLKAVILAIHPVNNTIDFETLQKGLFSPDSIYQTPTGKWITIKQADEIIEVFDRAVAKIREEAAIPALRQNWTDGDKQIWEILNESINRVSSGNVAEYSKKLKSKIRQSQNRYYKQHRPQNGNTVFRIKI